MDWQENEIRNDLDKVRALLDALKLKYDGNFSAVFSAGVLKDDEFWHGISISLGEADLIYQVCHGLLYNPRFINEFFDAVKYVLSRSAGDRPEFMVKMMQASVESMKMMLIRQTEAYKKYEVEEDVEQAVQHLIDSVFGNNVKN